MVVWQKHHCGHRELHEEYVGLVGRQGKGKRRKFMISSLEQPALRDMNTFTLGPPPEEGRRGSNSNGNGRKIIGGSRP